MALYEQSLIKTCLCPSQRRVCEPRGSACPVRSGQRQQCGCGVVRCGGGSGCAGRHWVMDKRHTQQWMWFMRAAPDQTHLTQLHSCSPYMTGWFQVCSAPFDTHTMTTVIMMIDVWVTFWWILLLHWRFLALWPLLMDLWEVKGSCHGNHKKHLRSDRWWMHWISTNRATW